MFKMRFHSLSVASAAAVLAILALGAKPALAASTSNCANLPTQADLINALTAAKVKPQWSVGLKNDMWAAIVDTHGVVCAVAKTGGSATGTQWLASRVIAAQKASTANSLSLNGDANGSPIALSTANLWAATQPGGSLFGLQASNPVDTTVAYGSNNTNNPVGDQKDIDALYGTATDPMVGWYIGGVNVFGGGFALYDSNKKVVGGLGLSGDTSCADHVKAWIVRDQLHLDYVPGGVSPTKDDNMINDVTGSHGNFESKGGFGHPTCGFGEEKVVSTLPTAFPISVTSAP
jgi:uncharacterized protein GlcG (DUF336 family)